MTNASTMYCSRCCCQVEPVRSWAGFRWVKRGWYAVLVLLAVLAPIIMSEITLLLPMAMVFGMAAGPIHMLASQPSTCRTCGAELATTKAELATTK